MGFFIKKSETGIGQPLYSLSQQRSFLLIGLGNVGAIYGHNRHNVGFMCLDYFAAAHDFVPWVDKKDLRARICSGIVGNSRVILCKPTTMMNLSGEAASRTCQFYKIQPAEVTVVYDELDINFGQIRSRVGGGSAGHNGVKSLIQHLGPEFGRLRIGIGPKVPDQIDSADFVLQDFTAEQQKLLPSLTGEVATIINEYIYGGALPTDTRSFV